MAFVKDKTYEAIEEVLMLHNGNVRDIAAVIMSYWFIKYPESLRKKLRALYPNLELKMEAGLQIINHTDWDHSLSKEAKLRVGIFLCNSVASNRSIVAMIVLKKLSITKLPESSSFWQYFLSDGLLYIYDLKTQAMKLQNFTDNGSDLFHAENVHDLKWRQEIRSRFTIEVEAKQLDFFGGRVTVGNKNYIRFCLPELNYDLSWFLNEIRHDDEETGFTVPEEWDRSDTFTIEDNWWFFWKG